jgi:hypothetical protein
MLVPSVNTRQSTSKSIFCDQLDAPSFLFCNMYITLSPQHVSSTTVLYSAHHQEVSIVLCTIWYVTAYWLPYMKFIIKEAMKDRRGSRGVALLLL